MDPTQQPQPVVLAVAPDAAAPPSTVAPTTAPLQLAGTMAPPPWFIILAIFTFAIIWGSPVTVFLPLHGKLALYIATFIGFFVAASVVLVGWCLPKYKFYKIFIMVYFYISVTAVYFSSTVMLYRISSRNFEWVLFGVMILLALASLLHDYLVHSSQFLLGVPIYLSGLIILWAVKCESAYGQGWVFYLPAIPVASAIILVHDFMHI